MADNEQLILSISADTRAMQRQLDKLVGQIGAVDNSLGSAFAKTPKDVDKVTKSLSNTRFETANLAAQFQDIAVQLQGGQSPFTVALQQGTQINQVLGRSGAGGVVSLLGTAFASLINPVSLATIGIIALGGFAVQYGLKAIGAVDDLDDKLKKHAELISSLKDAYGEAGKGVDTAVHEAQVTLKALLGLSTDALQKQFDALSRSAVRSMSDIVAVTDSVGGSTVIEQAAGKYDKFKDAIENFRASVNAGTPDVKNFRAAVSEIVNTTADEKVRKLGNELLTASDSAAKAELAVLGTAKAVRNFGAAALAAADQGEAFAKSLKALSTTVTPDLDDRQKVMKAYNDALVKAGSTEERLAAARARDDQLGIISANERKKAAEKAGREAESTAKRFQGSLDSSNKRTAQIQGQIDALGQGVGAVAKLETQYRLTEQAEQAFGKVTPEIAAKIDAVATAAGNAADKLARAKLAFSIGQDSQTSLLTPEDASIAKQLSQTLGLSVPDALKSSYAETIRWNDALKGVSTTMSSGLTTGLADILDGTKTAGEAFSDLGKTIVRALEEAVVKLYIVAPLMRALQGGLGGLIPSVGGAIPAFAAGTNFAPGGVALVGERGPELVNIPRGSQVVPNNRIQGGGSTSIVINNNTPAQVTARQVIDGRGNRSLQFTIDDAVAANMSRPGSATRGALRNNFAASPVGVRR